METKKITKFFSSAIVHQLSSKLIAGQCLTCKSKV